MILVSTAVVKDICAVLIIRDNKVVDTHVSRVKTDERDVIGNTYRSVLYGVRQGILRLRGMVSESGFKEIGHVTFEISSSVVLKWVRNCEAKVEYREDLFKMMSMLDEVPIEYSFVANPIVKAKSLAVESKLDSRKKLSGLTLD